MTHTRYTYMRTSELIELRKFDDLDYIVEIHARLEKLGERLREKAAKDAPEGVVDAIRRHGGA